MIAQKKKEQFDTKLATITAHKQLDRNKTEKCTYFSFWC